MREDIISSISVCANRLAAGGRQLQAEKLALDAIKKAPGSQELAKLLEKILSQSADPARAEEAYAGILGLPGLCPDNYYHLAMFHKRRGDYPGMRRALGRLLAAGAGADPVNRYIACCTLDRFSQAFETAESFIGSGRREPVLSRLWHPWGDRSDTLPPGFLADRLAALERARLGKKLEPYRSFFRGALLLLLGRNAESAAEFGRLAARPDLPDPRYGWMFFPAGWASLYACDYGSALRMFSRSARSPVSRSTSLGRIAEIYICTGRAGKGFQQLKKAFSTAAFGELPGLHSWEGQMRLFTGAYKAALKALTKGLALGDDVAFCWRGAALTLLGRRKEALRDLDRAVELFPTDAEAGVWRAETLRLEGRLAEALRDLDGIIASKGSRTWARVNRALVREALGDKAGMTEDFNALSPEVRKFLQSRTAGSRRTVKRMLEEACRRAMGNRRDDKYFFPVWMK
ncbi:MAG: tetratricopeptide repeat protein [Elusimicrobiota bacterium]|nr:tetratricopeptide repeat protein [Elusimicrobiota bacterium]